MRIEFDNNLIFFNLLCIISSFTLSQQYNLIYMQYICLRGNYNRDSQIQFYRVFGNYICHAYLMLFTSISQILYILSQICGIQCKVIIKQKQTQLFICTSYENLQLHFFSDLYFWVIILIHSLISFFQWKDLPQTVCMAWNQNVTHF
ncbi:hypothetical protein pb186bvf_011668 [Paramecium bursaria]